jgi:hypothetical protein
MTLNVKCSCGMIHSIKVGESAKCQCGAVVSIRKARGRLTPWATYDYPYPKSAGKPEIVNKPREWKLC